MNINNMTHYITVRRNNNTGDEWTIKRPTDDKQSAIGAALSEWGGLNDAEKRNAQITVEACLVNEYGDENLDIGTFPIYQIDSMMDDCRKLAGDIVFVFADDCSVWAFNRLCKPTVKQFKADTGLSIADENNEYDDDDIVPSIDLDELCKRRKAFNVAELGEIKYGEGVEPEDLEKAMTWMAQVRENREPLYDVYLVGNGSLRDFRNGIISTGYPDSPSCWGYGVDRDELKKIIQDVATDICTREDSEYTTEDARAEFINDSVSDRDPINWGLYYGDLKYVCIKSHDLDAD